jgi:glycosyltransferase involved in cell wall biosynthesis
MTELLVAATSPRVSVIIPAYNAADCVRRAVDSVFAQSFQDFELLVVDDGSTDPTQAVLAGYGDRLRLLAKENGGPAAARNHGLNHAVGDYVAFLDADDYWRPDKLDRQVALLDARPEIGFCSTATEVVDSAGRPAGEWPCRPDAGPLPDILFMQGTVISGSTSGVLARRRLIDEIGGFDPLLRGFEDPDLWIRLAARTDYACIPQPLTVVVRTANSVSGNLVNMRRATLASFRKNRSLLPPEKRGGYWREACARALTDYAKTTYRAGNRGRAMLWCIEALFRSPVRCGKLALSLLVAMMLKHSV